MYGVGEQVPREGKCQGAALPFTPARTRMNISWHDRDLYSSLCLLAGLAIMESESGVVVHIFECLQCGDRTWTD